jgi:hypothetical protein
VKGQYNAIASGQAYVPRITDCSQQYLFDLTKRSQEKKRAKSGSVSDKEMQKDDHREISRGHSRSFVTGL